MKNIVVSWIHSLKMLAPENFKPLALVTLKTLGETYKTIFKRLWWFVALGAVATVKLEFFRRYYGFADQIFAFALMVWVLLWVSLLILVARPSVALKDSAYFFHYSLIGLLFMGVLFGILSMPVSDDIRILLMSYCVFLGFFLSDTNYTTSEIVRAPWRALKMSIALLPIYFLITGLLYGVFVLLKSFFLGTFLGAVILVVGVFPLIIVLMSRLYILTIHKNYKEYYERCW